MQFLIKTCNFLDVLEILSHSLIIHLSYHSNIKRVVLASKTSTIFLSVRI